MAFEDSSLLEFLHPGVEIYDASVKPRVRGLDHVAGFVELAVDVVEALIDAREPSLELLVDGCHGFRHQLDLGLDAVGKNPEMPSVVLNLRVQLSPGIRDLLPQIVLGFPDSSQQVVPGFPELRLQVLPGTRDLRMKVSPGFFDLRLEPCATPSRCRLISSSSSGFMRAGGNLPRPG